MRNLLKKSVGITFIILCSFFVETSKAQVNVSFNVNTQPLWGPANVNYVEYYYLPEVDVYYNVPTSQYIYYNGGNWITVSNLPSRYQVDLYRTYKVVINEQRPYMKHSMYKSKYAKYKHSYNKQSPNRDHHNKGNAGNSKNGSKGKTSQHKNGGKGHKGK